MNDTPPLEPPVGQISIRGILREDMRRKLQRFLESEGWEPRWGALHSDVRDPGPGELVQWDFTFTLGAKT